MRYRRSSCGALIFTLVLLASPGLAATPATPEPQLGTGVQQVESGDLEGAVSTLQAVVERLRARSDRSPGDPSARTSISASPTSA